MGGEMLGLVFAIVAVAAAELVAVGNAASASAELASQGTEYEQGHNRRPDI